MAAIINDVDVLLQAAGTRLLPVQLPSNYTTTGDHSGTLNGSAQTNFQNSQITLSSDGTLNDAGGGQVDLDYTNILGAKPPSNADNTQTKLENAATSIEVNSSTFLEMPGSGSAGVFLGSGGLFGKDSGGSTTFSIDASDGDVIFKGDITGGANIDITGQGRFEGSTSSGAGTGSIVANENLNNSFGVVAWGSSAAFTGISSGGAGVKGTTNGSGTGVQALSFGSGPALQVGGRSELQGSTTITGALTISTQTISNLTAGVANSVAGANVTGTVANATNATNADDADDSAKLGGYDDALFCRRITCDVGTAITASSIVNLTATVSGVETAATGGANVVIRTISDIRKKTAVAAETLGLDFVDQLTPVTYRFKHNQAIKHHGFIAQDVEKIVGEGDDALALTHGDGMKGTDYMSLVGVLVKAIQELNEKVQVLTNENGLNK